MRCRLQGRETVRDERLARQEELQEACVLGPHAHTAGSRHFRRRPLIK